MTSDKEAVVSMPQYAERRPTAGILCTGACQTDLYKAAALGFGQHQEDLNHEDQEPYI